MRKRDELYLLSGVMELDEGFFSTEIEEKEKGTPLKRGRGSQKKTKVLVMAESHLIEGQTHKKVKNRQVGHLKMVVIHDLKSDTLTSMVEKNISKDTIIDSDHSTSYYSFEGYC
jgi:hypothetical protein